jgi:hypothetical protein
MVSGRTEEYLDKATRCFELAARFPDDTLRENLAAVAGSYLLLARLEERLAEQPGLGLYRHDDRTPSRRGCDEGTRSRSRTRPPRSGSQPGRGRARR